MLHLRLCSWSQVSFKLFSLAFFLRIFLHSVWLAYALAAVFFLSMFFLVAAAKCSLEIVVSFRHPGFSPPVKKDLGYFSNDSRTMYSLEVYLTNWQIDGQPSRQQNRMLYEPTPCVPVWLRMNSTNICAQMLGCDVSLVSVNFFECSIVRKIWRKRGFLCQYSFCVNFLDLVFQGSESLSTFPKVRYWTTVAIQ